MRQVFALIIVVVSVSCSEAPAPWTGTIEVIDGVRVVTNPTEPLAREDGVTVRELWSYSGPATGDVWHEPNGVAASDRFVYVLDRPASQVHIVNVDGTPSASVGSPGQGPGEYSEMLVAAIPTPDGTFIVDSGNSRIDILDDAHVTVASYRMDGMAVWAMQIEDGIVAGGMFDMSSGQRVFTVDGMAGEYGSPEWDASDPDADICTRPASLDGHAVLTRCTRPDVRIYSSEGALLTDISVPIEPEIATDEEVRARVDQIREDLTFAPSEVVDALVDDVENSSREKPSVRALVTDRDLLLVWGQNPESYGSGPASLYVLTASGIFLDQLEFDEEWVDFNVRDGTLYVLSPDPITGLVSLRALELSIPEGLLARAAEIG